MATRILLNFIDLALALMIGGGVIGLLGLGLIKGIEVFAFDLPLFGGGA
jgi:hypothetical protein